MFSRVFCYAFVLGVLSLGACASEGDDDDDDDDDDDVAGCQQGATQACVCAGGDSGGQVCDDGAWGQCLCGDDQPPPACETGETQACTCNDGSSGAQECFGGFWQACECEGPDGPVIGDPCFGPDDCEGGAQQMLCVLQNGDDIQGICTITCGDFGDCLGGPVPAFYDCCDLSNGSFACAPDDWECAE